MQKKKLYVAALVLIVIAFIFLNSLMPGNTSNVISDKFISSVTDVFPGLANLVNRITPWITSGTVRKLAHIAEFAMLGIAATLLVLFRKKSIKQQLPILLLLGLGSGVIDETIQLFTHRTSTVKDIWIDLFGFGLGLISVWLVSAILYKRKATP